MQLYAAFYNAPYMFVMYVYIYANRESTIGQTLSHFVCSCAQPQKPFQITPLICELNRMSDCLSGVSFCLTAVVFSICVFILMLAARQFHLMIYGAYT